jgi:protein-S-isoprenylcysteine O-methyltransferase Ste14
LHTNSTSWVIGWVLIGLGLGTMLTVIAWFGLHRSVGREVNVLKQSGPYRLTRNPQILACLLAVVGYAMIWPSWNSAGWVVLFSVFAHMMVLTEEEHLRTVHGEAYRRYCERTPRYLGFTQRPGGTA